MADYVDLKIAKENQDILDRCEIAVMITAKRVLKGELTTGAAVTDKQKNKWIRSVTGKGAPDEGRRVWNYIIAEYSAQPIAVFQNVDDYDASPATDSLQEVSDLIVDFLIVSYSRD